MIGSQRLSLSMAGVVEGLTYWLNKEVFTAPHAAKIDRVEFESGRDGDRLHVDIVTADRPEPPAPALAQGDRPRAS